jgi:putative hydrolase of the HAD superfamily
LDLVFDLGGVLVRWDPQAIAAGVFAEASTRSLVLREIFQHPQRTGLPAAEVARLLKAVPPSLVPIGETVALLHRLKAQGHRLYCLSNMHLASIEHLEATHDFFALFHGKVISCRLNFCKPEPEIYRHLLEAHALQPSRTVFIDDVEANVAAARQLGMHAIRFENAAQCERELAIVLAR